MFWGFWFLMHGVGVFIRGKIFTKAWEEKKIREYIKRLQALRKRKKFLQAGEDKKTNEDPDINRFSIISREPMKDRNSREPCQIRNKRAKVTMGSFPGTRLSRESGRGVLNSFCFRFQLGAG